MKRLKVLLGFTVFFLMLACAVFVLLQFHASYVCQAQGWIGGWYELGEGLKCTVEWGWRI